MICKLCCGTFHCMAAADRSAARAAAAAMRKGSHASLMLDDPPVALMPNSRAILPTIHSPTLTLAGFSSPSDSSGWNGSDATNMLTLP